MPSGLQQNSYADTLDSYVCNRHRGQHRLPFQPHHNCLNYHHQGPDDRIVKYAARELDHAIATLGEAATGLDKAAATLSRAATALERRQKARRQDRDGKRYKMKAQRQEREATKTLKSSESGQEGEGSQSRSSNAGVDDSSAYTQASNPAREPSNKRSNDDSNARAQAEPLKPTQAIKAPKRLRRAYPITDTSNVFRIETNHSVTLDGPPGPSNNAPPYPPPPYLPPPPAYPPPPAAWHQHRAWAPQFVNDTLAAASAGVSPSFHSGWHFW